MDKESFSQRALRWWREQFPHQPDSASPLESIVREQLLLPGLKLVIDEKEVEWQTQAFDHTIDFPEALKILLQNFLLGAESSTSLRDVAILSGLLEDTSPTESLRALLDQGMLYLLSADYLDRIERKALPFHRPDYTRRISLYWTFGLLLPALTPWEFIGFVNRRDALDVYHTGYRPENAG